MSRYATKSGFVEISFDLKAYETKTIDFLDVQPNYYRVQNMGSSKLYCGVSKMPTTEDYDFVVKPEGLKLYAEPFKRGFLYLFNPSGSPTKGKIVAFAAEFDPLSLALSDIEIDMSDVALTTTTAINEFRAALPAGTNNIGKVQVSNLNNYTTTLSNILSTLSELIKSSAGTNAVNLHDILTRLDEIVYAQNNEKSYNNFYSGTATSTATQYDADSGYRFVEIAFFSNDGDSNITFTTIDTNGRTQNIVIKAGEVLNNVKCRCPSVSVSGSGEYRLAMIEREE